jgi:predicted nucleic acid-binding protein
MDDVFADACYWIAKLNGRDSLHEIAVLLSDTLGPRRIVTTALVLGEILNFFAELGPVNRRGAVTLVRELHDNPDVEAIELADI